MVKFNFGNIYMTKGIDDASMKDAKFCRFVETSLKRHLEGDWGDLCKEDKELNDYALKSGDDRILSKYDFNNDTSIYIITEWDRSATTILFPDEY